MFRANCTPNSPRATRASRFPVPACQTRYRAMPMRVKSVIQTGANTQPGGVKNGFSREMYQEPGPVAVTSDPRLPAMMQNSTDAASFGYDRIADLRSGSMGMNISWLVL